jgi:hypothetical protein
MEQGARNKRHKEEKGMRKRTQVLHSGDRREPHGVSGGTQEANLGKENASSLGDPEVRRFENWPFKFSLDDNRWYLNKAKRRYAKRGDGEDGLL